MKRTNKIIAWILILAMLLSGYSVNAKAGEETLQTSSEVLTTEPTNTAEVIGEKMQEISETLLTQENISEWMIFDLAAYGSEIPAEKKEAYIQSAKEAVNGEYAAGTDFAKAAIIFGKLGIDTSDAGGINIPEKIRDISEFNTYSDAIWVLISDTLDSVELSDEQKRKAVEKISESVNEKGIIFGSYGGYVYEDADSTGAAIGALSSLSDSDDAYGAAALREKMINALSQSQLETGSFGSACTDAFVIIGLCAANIDADKDARFQKGENSLLDGLMSYAISGGFAGYDGTLDIAWSTEQGFRALIAYEKFSELGSAYDIYYSTVETVDENGNENIGEKMQEISETLLTQENISEWMIFDLAAYGSEIPAEKKEAYIQSAKEAVNGEYAAGTDFAKAAIIFGKLGIDTSDAGGINIPEKIRDISEFNTYSDAIWILISDTLDNIELSDEQKRKAVEKISESVNEKGIIFGSYGGYVYEDADSTGAAIGALSSLADSEDTYGAEALREKMINALSQSQLENGSFGSACTDAFVIIGLCAANIDADKDARFQKGENSLLDGLMSYAISGGFAGYDGTLDIAWSTEQGFRALIAYEKFSELGSAYDIYYSTVETEEPGQDELPEEGEDGEDEKENNTDNGIGRPSGGGLNADTNHGSTSQDKNDAETEDTDSEPNDTENKTENSDDEEIHAAAAQYITVSFEMRTHKSKWLKLSKVKVKNGCSVRDLISQVFDEHGITSKGLLTGYLRSVTFNGETWGEFDAGPASGWQYYVNGSLPNVGITSYKLKDKDSVELVYTADYTAKDNNSSKENNKTQSKEENTSWKNPFVDVKESDWYFEDVRNVYTLGLMKGVADSRFAPKDNLSRAMFVTVIYRLEGSPKAGKESFKDVNENDWFYDAVAWASKNGIVSGVSKDTFAPGKPITREQMATVVYRYAVFKGKNKNVSGNVKFLDASKISDYALTAVKWVSANEIMNGSSNKFNPQSATTRCEAAAVFGRIYTLFKK